MSIDKEFLAEESGVDESKVENSDMKEIIMNKVLLLKEIESYYTEPLDDGEIYLNKNVFLETIDDIYDYFEIYITEYANKITRDIHDKQEHFELKRTVNSHINNMLDGIKN